MLAIKLVVARLARNANLTGFRTRRAQRATTPVYQC